MPSTYSPKLRFELVGAGEQAGLWGTTTNKNVGQLIEQAIAGVTTVELDGLSGNYTLTALDGTADQSRSAVLKCTYTTVPATAQVNIIIPTSTKLYVVYNSCGQTIVVKTAAQVGGVTLLNGESTLVFCDGANAYPGIATASVGTLTVSGGGTGVATFGSGGIVKSSGGTAALTAGAVSLTAEVSGVLPVANGGTGLSSPGTAGNVLVSNGSGWASSAITSIPPGLISLWYGSIASIPAGWYLCNGSNGTPDLRDRFIVGAGSSYAVGGTGGSADAIVVSHSHSASSSSSFSGSALGTHTHTATSVVTDPGHTHTINDVAYFNISINDRSGGVLPPHWSGISGTTFNGISSATTGITVATTNTAASAGTPSGSVSTSTSISTSGSSGTGANLPPYYALAYIMKA